MQPKCVGSGKVYATHDSTVNTASWEYTTTTRAPGVPRRCRSNRNGSNAGKGRSRSREEKKRRNSRGKKTQKGGINRKKKRARTKKGGDKADKPASRDLNEAYIATEDRSRDAYRATRNKFFTLY